MPVIATLDTIHADNVALLSALANLTQQVQLLNLVVTNAVKVPNRDYLLYKIGNNIDSTALAPILDYIGGAGYALVGIINHPPEEFLVFSRPLP